MICALREYASSMIRSPIIIFNVQCADRPQIRYTKVEKSASVKDIYIRTGGGVIPAVSDHRLPSRIGKLSRIVSPEAVVESLTIYMLLEAMANNLLTSVRLYQVVQRLQIPPDEP